MSRPPTITLLAARLHSGGVADHVALLATALTERGADVRTCSGNSDFVAAIQACENSDGKHWVGLHFVAYGWARHGILRRSDIARLRAACAARHVVLYLHELWIGAERGASLKHRFIGAFQRRGLLRLHAALRPEHVLTSNPVYQAMLAREGIAASTLPLPGNLPAPSETDRREARAWLTTVGLRGEQAPDLAAIFGLIHPDWDATPALAEWCASRAASGHPTALLTLGRHGAAGPRKLAGLRERIPGLRIVSTGEKPAPLLAGLLAECSLGFATSPWALIGKSGTAAAFLDAGLPVVVTRDEWQWRDGPTPPPLPHPALWRWTSTPSFAWGPCLDSRSEARPSIARVADAWLRLTAAP